MKIEVLWSSPNTDGLTAAAKDRVTEGLASAGADVGEIHVNRRKLISCMGCGKGYGTCATKGRCCLNDDGNDIYERLIAADAFVIVTAVYWHDITEPLKIVTDRIRRCETKVSHALKGKHDLLVACAGGSGHGAARCICCMEEWSAQIGVDPLERLPVTRFNREYMLKILPDAGRQFVKRLAELAAEQ